MLNSRKSTKIVQEQDTLMNANTCTHKQLGVNSGLQKSLENARICLKKTCIEHITFQEH